MGQVILSLEEYDQLKKKADGKEELAKCFELDKDYNGKVQLNISIQKAQEIFKVLFEGSKFDDGTYVINEKESDYNEGIASYYINATKNLEPKEELVELTYEEEDKENGN